MHNNCGEIQQNCHIFQIFGIIKSAKILRFSGKRRILGVFLMYIASNNAQLTIEGIFLPFGDKLLKSNRWVKLAAITPWERIE